jgi:drug/metabolite transporter (DMT)-like permease
MSETRSYVLLHFIVLIWGFTAILGKLISLPPVEVVFYRTAIAAVALFILLALWKRPMRFDDPRIYLFLLGTGGLVAIHWILFFLSARVANVSVCLAGLATCSLWTAFIEPLYYRRKVKGFEVFLGALGVLGMVVIFQVEFKYWVGLLLAILSAFISSVFTIINAEFVRRDRDPFVITLYEMVGAFLFVLIYLPFYQLQSGPFVWLGWNLDVLWLAILAIVCTVYAYSASVKLMKRISPFTMNLTVNMEPIYGIILALVIFGSSEEMSGGFYLGTGLILTSVLAYPVINRLQSRKPLDNRHVAPY